MFTAEELEQQIRAQHSAALLVNTRSRRGERLVLLAKDALAARGITVGPIFPVRNTDHLRQRVREAIDLGHRLVIIGGGDGTISSSCGAFAYQDIVLGILPFGTGNSFARTLDIPIDLTSAVDVIAAGKVARVDLGMIDGEYFTNSISLGVSADVSRSTKNRLKRLLGEFAYVFVGIGVLARHCPFLFRFATDSYRREFYAHEVIIENGRYYGDTQLTDDFALEDRRLIVMAMEAMTRWQLLSHWGAFLLGMPSAIRRMRRFTVQQIHIETEPEKYLDVDGEVIRQTPARISVAPRALNILVPRSLHVG